MKRFLPGLLALFLTGIWQVMKHSCQICGHTDIQQIDPA